MVIGTQNKVLEILTKRPCFYITFVRLLQCYYFTEQDLGGPLLRGPISKEYLLDCYSGYWYTEQSLGNLNQEALFLHNI